MTFWNITWQAQWINYGNWIKSYFLLFPQKCGKGQQRFAVRGLENIGQKTLLCSMQECEIHSRYVPYPGPSHHQELAVVPTESCSVPASQAYPSGDGQLGVISRPLQVHRPRKRHLLDHRGSSLNWAPIFDNHSSPEMSLQTWNYPGRKTLLKPSQLGYFLAAMG